MDRILTASDTDYDRAFEVKALDETKAGIKGLVDSGIAYMPRIFIHSQKDLHNYKPTSPNSQLKFPLIDIGNINEDPARRKEVVEEVQEASGTWGFFQVVNHGIPGPVLKEMLDGVRKFYEQDAEERKKWYTRDTRRSVVYNSNFDLYSAPAANWRDTFYCQMAAVAPRPEELPPACSRHADSDFLTVLLNDQVSGLQVLYENQWVDVPPLPGALVVNIGDLLQLVSNDRFISAEHRVVASNVSSRVSVAAFFRSSLTKSSKLYGPIQELISEDNPPKYRATTVNEYITCFNTKGPNGTSALSHFRIEVN